MQRRVFQVQVSWGSRATLNIMGHNDSQQGSDLIQMREGLKEWKSRRIVKGLERDSLTNQSIRSTGTIGQIRAHEKTQEAKAVQLPGRDC